MKMCFFFMNTARLFSTHMGVDYVVIGFDMEVQPLVTHNAAGPLCVSTICIDHLHICQERCWHRCREHP